MGQQPQSTMMFVGPGFSQPDELVRPRHRQPLAIKFLTAEPGPFRSGIVTSVGTLAEALAQPGVVQADTYVEIGETIRPVSVDIDRRGYVIALGSTTEQSLSRVEHAARLIRIEVEDDLSHSEAASAK